VIGGTLLLSELRTLLYLYITELCGPISIEFDLIRLHDIRLKLRGILLFSLFTTMCPAVDIINLPVKV
jgi:hypothetical protein